MLLTFCGLRQEDMAHLLGVSRQTIIAMENDKYDPTLELAIKTARLLDQPVESISSSRRRNKFVLQAITRTAGWGHPALQYTVII